MLDPLPRDFRNYAFVAAYEERFKTSLREGVQGTAMPPWKEILTDEEIDSLIQYIKEKSLEMDESVADADDFVRIEVELPMPGDPERLDFREKGLVIEPGDPARGLVAFQKNCTSCHGKLANGKGPNAYYLEHPLPRNLLNKEYMNQPYMTDERLYQSILLGVAGMPMPSHDHLSDQTILDMIAYIRSNTTEESE